MMNLELLIDLHKDGARQGPGDEKLTKLAIDIAGLGESDTSLKILDVGSGTGASTLVLAKYLDAEIMAVDLSSELLQVLEEATLSKGFSDKITTLKCSMDNLPFPTNSFDVIWGEGSIYIMGFKKGVGYFNRYLKPGGILAVSEITWLTSSRPDELTSYWQKEYSEIAIASKKIKILEDHGFTMKGYFPLPKSAWLDNYYLPLQDRFATFLASHKSKAANQVINCEQREIEMYNKYCSYYSYGFYIAQKGFRDTERSMAGG